MDYLETERLIKWRRRAEKRVDRQDRKLARAERREARYRGDNDFPGAADKYRLRAQNTSDKADRLRTELRVLELAQNGSLEEAACKALRLADVAAAEGFKRQGRRLGCYHEAFAYPKGWNTKKRENSP